MTSLGLSSEVLALGALEGSIAGGHAVGRAVIWPSASLQDADLRGDQAAPKEILVGMEAWTCHLRRRCLLLGSCVTTVSMLGYYGAGEAGVRGSRT